MSKFQKSQRQQAKIKLAITGPPGSGKTYSALRIATGFGGKIALIDTENKSSSFYDHKFDFGVIYIAPPFTNEKYISAIDDAVKEGFDILIIDSLSHQWAEEGGILQQKAKMDEKPGSNSYTNWNRMTPEHNKFKSQILQADIHVIGTMRSKVEYILEQNDKGKMVPRKVGMAPIQRDGMEYEFTTIFDCDATNKAEVSKDRTGLFTGQYFQIDENTGKKFKDWLMLGKVVEPPKQEAPSSAQTSGQVTPPSSTGTRDDSSSTNGNSGNAINNKDIPKSEITDAERAHVIKLAKDKGWGNDQVVGFIGRAWSKQKVLELTKLQYQELIAVIGSKTYDDALKAYNVEDQTGMFNSEELGA